jgi:hypothetical protein
MSKTISIDVVADVQRAVVGLEAVNNRLDRLDKQSDKTGRGFGSFVEHVRDLAVAQVAVNALSKGFPDLSPAPPRTPTTPRWQPETPRPRRQPWRPAAPPWRSSRPPSAPLPRRRSA